MARRPDATDHLCYCWAETRRQLLGLTNPRTQREFIGAIRCSIGGRCDLGGGGRGQQREQHFPEVFIGDALVVNLAVKRMPPELRTVMDLHFCLGRGAGRRAQLIGWSESRYWSKVNDAKRFVEGYVAARKELGSGATL